MAKTKNPYQSDTYPPLFIFFFFSIFLAILPKKGFLRSAGQAIPVHTYTDKNCIVITLLQSVMSMTS